MGDNAWIIAAAALANGKVGDFGDHFGTDLVPVCNCQVIGILGPYGFGGFDGKLCIGIARDDRLAGMLVIHILDHGRFIQQIKERELLSSLQIARDVTKRIENVNFVFALKPECYKPDHQSLAAPRIRLSATSNKVFLRSLRAADYLLSPVTNTDSIITPPLTWLEAMAIGVPIVTNRVPGVEAVIQSGINGFVAESIASISDLFDLVISQENRDAMRENARAHVLTSYRVDRSAAEYQALWRTLLERR